MMEDRRVRLKRTLQSKAQDPHFPQSLEVEFIELALREKANHYPEGRLSSREHRKHTTSHKVETLAVAYRLEVDAETAEDAS